MFQFGRYLLLSSSRPGTLPANLQGLWNDYVKPPWACDYHNNINVQMAYWGAEPANLSECHEALVNYVEAMAPGCRDASQANKGFNTKDGKPVRGWTVRTPRISSVATAGSGTFPVRPGMRCIYGNIMHLPVIESIWKNRRIP